MSQAIHPQQVRALPRLSSLLGGGLSRLVDAVALYLAKPAKQCRAATAVDTQALCAMLRHGDVLLTDGNTHMAAIVRRLTRSPWSHVAMYVGPLEDGPDPRCIVEADVADGVRAVPLSAFQGQRVRVLRPTGLEDADRRRLADWVVRRIGAEYDRAHAWALARRLLGLQLASRSPAPSSTMAQGATRFICSSLLAQAFLLVGYQIVPIHLGVRDTWAADHRYVTPRDFESASGFEVVRATKVD